MAFNSMRGSRKAPAISSIDTLRFSYSTGTMVDSQVAYEIECKDSGCIATVKPDGVPADASKFIDLNEEAIDKIITLLNDNSVIKWDGFKKVDQNVLDGNGFSFSLIANKEKLNVSASGYMKWPTNYNKVRDGLDAIFEGTFSEEELTELKGY